MQKSHMFSVKIVLIILQETHFHSSNNEMLEATMVWGEAADGEGLFSSLVQVCFKCGLV